MKANQSERLRRSKEFEVNLSRLRANQIETMIDPGTHLLGFDLTR